MAASFVAAAAVTWAFGGASNSASRTIPTADSVFLGVIMTDATSDTVASTIAAASPTASYQATGGPSETSYLAVFVAAPAGAQTVAVSGGDAGDEWSCGFRGLDDLDTTTPFNNQVTDTVSPASISVTTTSDGLAVGVCFAEGTTITTSDTEVFEGPGSASGFCVSCASSPGTGGSVSLDWSGDVVYSSIAVNIRAGAAGGGAPGPGIRGANRVYLRGVGQGIMRNAR